MRRYKPDMMTVLVVLVAIGVITTTNAQSQEINNKKTPYMRVSLNCIDIVNSTASCRSGLYLIQGVKPDSRYDSDSKLWRPHTFDREEGAYTTSLFALKNHTCDNISTLDQGYQYAGISDMKIGLSPKVTLDFEMEDVSNFEISGIILGFKDCWN